MYSTACTQYNFVLYVFLYIDRRYDMLEIGGTNNMYYVNMILNNKWTHCNIAPLHQLGTCHNNK